MGIKDIFIPKYRRMRKVRSLRDQELIGTIAQNDGNPDVRKVAIMKLRDRDLLINIAKNESDKTTRKIALDRLMERLVLYKAPSLNRAQDIAHRLLYTSLLSENADRDAIIMSLKWYLENPVKAGFNAAQLAALVLGAIGGSEAAQVLVNYILENGDHWCYAAKALREIGDESALDHLISAASEANSSVQIKVVQALGVIGNKRAKKALVHVIQDNSGELCDAAVKSLGELRDVAEGGSEVAHVLVEYILDNDVLWCYAAKALRKIQDESALNHLISAASGANSSVQIKAIQALGVISNRRATKPLIHVIQDNSGEVRDAAVKSIGEIRDDVACDALVELLKTEPSSDLRKQVLCALAEINSQDTIPSIREALCDSDSSVRKSAEEALYKMHVPLHPLPSAEVNRIRSLVECMIAIDEPRVVDEPLEIYELLDHDLEVLNPSGSRIEWAAGERVSRLLGRGCILIASGYKWESYDLEAVVSELKRIREGYLRMNRDGAIKFVTFRSLPEDDPLLILRGLMHDGRLYMDYTVIKLHSGKYKIYMTWCV